MENKDFVDAIMNWPIMKPFLPLYRKYEQPLRFFFFGCLTTLVNFIIYILLCNVLKIGNIPSTIISWVCSVSFAYGANKIHVYLNHDPFSFKEYFSFFNGRVLTGLLEVAFMFVTVDCLKFNNLICKAACSCLMAVLNYFFAKLVVFK